MPFLVPCHDPIEEAWLISYESLCCNTFALDWIRNHGALNFEVLFVKFSPIIQLNAVLRLSIVRMGPILSDQSLVCLNTDLLILKAFGSKFVNGVLWVLACHSADNLRSFGESYLL